MLAGVAVTAAVPQPLPAQTDSSSLHFTIAEWADATWLYLLDRGAVDGGRLGDRGTLQRFHPGIDSEHRLDLISSRFSVSEEYVWHSRPQGVRYWGGSIQHRDVVAGVNLKAAVPLGGAWSARVRFDKEDGPQVERNYLRIAFQRDWSSGLFSIFEGSLVPMKPEMDITVGGGWRDASGEATVSLTWLDTFNDAIYQGLVVFSGFADTAIDYEAQAFAVRASLKRSVGSHLRLEGDLGIQLPARIRAYRQVAPDSGFRQEERFAQAAALAEWSFSHRVRAGGFATYVRAVSDRTPLSQSDALDDFRLVEKTTNVGGFVLADITRRWRVEAWLARNWRPELRDYRSGAAPAPTPAPATDVDYEDRSWIGQAVLGYRANSGFRASAAFEVDLGEVKRGADQVPSVDGLGQDETRVRVDLGWDVSNRFAVAAGSNWDLDGDGSGKRFDGAHGKFVLYW